jgi:hypothetical protein
MICLYCNQEYNRINEHYITCIQYKYNNKYNQNLTYELILKLLDLFVALKLYKLNTNSMITKEKIINRIKNNYIIRHQMPLLTNNIIIQYLYDIIHTNKEEYYDLESLINIIVNITKSDKIIVNNVLIIYKEMIMNIII